MASGATMLSHKTWAVVGDVLNASKPASRIVDKLRSHGKTVYLVNPRAGGQTDPKTNDPVYASITDLADKQIDVIDLVINPTTGLQVINDAKAVGINNIYAQPGADSPDVIQAAKNNNISIHQGCVLVDL